MIDEAEVLDRIQRRYCKDAGNGPSAIMMRHVRNAAGFDAARVADALVMGCWPSKGLLLEGFEVKCSRSDLLVELKAPEKAAAFSTFCDRWWLVLSDRSLIADGELPESWGLLVCSGVGLRKIVDAPPLPAEPLPRSMLASMMRAAATRGALSDVEIERMWA